MTKFYRLICLLGTISLFSACSDTTELGLSLVEQEPSSILFTDTLAVNLTTQPSTRFISSNLTRWVAGAYEDPIFGQVNTSFYTNFKIDQTNLSFDNCTVDSIVLSLAYDVSGHYGQVLTNPSTQIWEVLELDETIDAATTYSSGQSFATKATALASNVSFTPNITDSVTIDGTTYKPHLRIVLDNNFAERLLNPTEADVYLNNNSFKQYFKGLQVRPVTDPSNNSILRFVSGDSLSKITLYYTDNSSNVSKKQEFLTVSDFESVVKTDVDYSNTNVLANNTSDTLSYVHGVNGASVKITFPTLANLGRIVVNKAELYVYSTQALDSLHPIPKRLILAEKIDTTYPYINDISTSTSDYVFGGLPNQVDNNITEYKMNLSRYMQRIVNGYVADSAAHLQVELVTLPNRITINNQNSSTYKAKLSLTYTKID